LKAKQKLVVITQDGSDTPVIEVKENDPKKITLEFVKDEN